MSSALWFLAGTAFGLVVALVIVLRPKWLPRELAICACHNQRGCTETAGCDRLCDHFVWCTYGEDG